MADQSIPSTKPCTEFRPDCSSKFLSLFGKTNNICSQTQQNFCEISIDLILSLNDSTKELISNLKLRLEVVYPMCKQSRTF